MGRESMDEVEGVHEYPWQSSIQNVYVYILGEGRRYLAFAGFLKSKKKKEKNKNY